jgi:hypothetical protein
MKKTGGSPWNYVQPVFMVGGNNVRVTGLRLEGEMKPQDDTSVSASKYLVGLRSVGRTSFEVDNCEIYGWSWAGILLGDGVATVGNAYIHHNYIHSNQARGEGYGVEIYRGTVLVEANIFDKNRHSVTGSGVEDESYEARYNHVLGHGNAIGASHFDVHHNPDGGTYSGYSYKIHHNTIEYVDHPVYAIGYRGDLPESGVWVDHNIIEWSDSWSDRPVFESAMAAGKTHISQNMVGIPPALKTGASGVVMYK